MVYFIVLASIYVIAMIALGYRASKRVTSVESYAASSGDIGPLATAITYAATFSSAGYFLGVAGQGFAFGVTNIWFWASQWTTTCLCLCLIARRYRRVNKNIHAASVADWVADRYGSPGLRVFLALVSLLQLLYVASQLVGVGIVINHMIPSISYQTGICIAAVVIIVYISMGGTYAHVYTNVAQGAMMCVLALVIFFTGFFLFGNVFTEVPELLSQIDPKLAMGVNPDNAGYPTVSAVVWMFIAHLWWTMNPQIIGKCTYLKSDRDIKKFIIYTAICMFLMGSVVLGGSYARILLPEGIGSTVTGMDNAMPWFITQVYPEVVAAIFLCVILAASMSTVDGILLYMSVVVGNTWYNKIFLGAKRARGEHVDEAKAEKTTMSIMKWSVYAIGIIAIPIAFSKPTNLTVMLWSAAGTIMSAVAGPVVVGLYSKKAGKGAALLGSIGGCASFCILYFGHIIGSVYQCCGIGGFISVVLTLIGIPLFKKMDHAHAEKMFAGVNVSEEVAE